MSNETPHDQIEARLIIFFIGLILLFDGIPLWVNIVGGVFAAFAVLRILWRDVYKALR